MIPRKKNNKPVVQTQVKKKQPKKGCVKAGRNKVKCNKYAAASGWHWEKKIKNLMHFSRLTRAQAVKFHAHQETTGVGLTKERLQRI